MQERPRVDPSSPTSLRGHYIVFPGQKNGITNTLFSQTSFLDYNELCSEIWLCFWLLLIIKELIWKNNYPALQSNKANSLGRLNSLVKNDDVFLMSLLLTFNIFHTLLQCFYCQLWAAKLFLNECLKVIIQFKPMLLCGNTEKYFLLIKIRETARNLLTFHWERNFNPNQVEINRFTRLVLGFTQSPFNLERALLKLVSKIT